MSASQSNPVGANTCFCIQKETIAKTLNPKSKCAIVAFAVGAVVGIAFIVLGALQFLGPMGSIEFIATICSGGVLTLVAAGGLLWIVLSKRKETQNKENQKSTPLPWQETTYQPGLEAVDLVKKLAKNTPKTNQNEEDCHSVSNSEIEAVLELYHHDIYPAFENALKTNRENPWKNSQVIQAADNVMKAAYTISYLVLQDLPNIVKKTSEQEGKELSVEEVLSCQDQYPYTGFSECSNAYTWIRFAVEWREKKENDEKDWEGFHYPDPDKIDEEHCNAKYHEGKRQYQWRMLYNDFCERANLYAPHIKAFEKDE